MTGCVILSGGYAHPFAESSAELAAIVAATTGDGVTVVEDPAAAAAALAGARLLVVNGLWWSMTQHAKYAADRAAWAYAVDAATLAALAGFVAAGGGLLAVHTATICFDTAPGWRDLLGGGWTWGRSHHPPCGAATVALTAAGRALAGVDQFALTDEVYHALDPAADATILATADAGGGPQPVAWLRRHGRGTVGVDALGHDAASLCHPGHRALLGGMIRRLAA